MKTNGLRGIYEFDDYNEIVKNHIMIGAWNINYIAYYLIKFSNDEKTLKIKTSLNRYMLYLLSLFRNIDKGEVENMKKYGTEIVLEAFGNEQFKYQLSYNYFDDINRLIYIYLQFVTMIKKLQMNCPK